MTTPTTTPKPSTPNLITLSNGVIVLKPLNLHSAWARVANVKLNLGSIGISLTDIIITLCLKDIVSVCPGFTMPNAQLPTNILALDADTDLLKKSYAVFAEVYCAIPMCEWKVIRTEMLQYLDTNTL